jgi:hypothetical protein
MPSKLVRSTNDGSVGLTDIDALYSYTVLLTGNDVKASFGEIIAASKNGIDRYFMCSIWHDAPEL